jgi:hypothetical protein
MNKPNNILISMQLMGGVTVISECSPEPDEYGYYLLTNPMKPVLIGEALVFTPMNSFSDSIEYKIHIDKILTIGDMHFEYIDKYYESVEKFNTDTKNKYDRLMEDDDRPKSKQSSIYVEPDSTLIN